MKHRGIAAVAAAAALVAGLGATSGTAHAAKVVKCKKGITLAFFGPQTGGAANLGINISNGVEVAIAQFNKANRSCQVALKKFDSQGDPKQAPGLAQTVVNDKNIVGVVGPAFSGETKATGQTFAENNVPTVSASATNPSLSKNGWATFHRVVGNDDKQGPAAARFIKNNLSAKTVGVIDDASEYGKGLADIVKRDLGAAVVASDTIVKDAPDYSAAVNKMKDKSPDAIFYGGYYQEAGKLAKQLRDAGVKSTLVFGDGVLDQGYIDAAGKDAAAGSAIACTCAAIADDSPFGVAYKAKFNTSPGTYSAEAFDATNVFLDAFKAGKTARKTINTYIAGYSKQGISKVVKFDATGELTGGGENVAGVFLVKDGKISDTPVGVK